MRDAGARVEEHDDHFAQDAPDAEWIPDVARRGWIILTKDKNIRRRAGEREAILLSSARVFTLTSGNMRAAEMSTLFVNRLPAMEQFVAEHGPPFVAVLGRDHPIPRVVFPREPDASVTGERPD